MKNLRISETWNRTFVLFLIVTFSITAWGKSKNKIKHWKASVCERIDSILDNDMFNSSQVGVCIYDLTDDSFIYNHNERQTMRPASTQKLITAITALDMLKPNYKIRTSLMYTGEINNGTLEGTLFCKGNFDPMLSRHDIVHFAKHLKECGIDTIRGIISIDKSMKDKLEFGKGWCWDDDNPSLSPLTVNGYDNFLFSMAHALDNEGVVLDALSNNACTPDSAILLCETHHTVSDILHDMMKESNNFHAESLFYNIAASQISHNASSEDAARVISSLAQEMGHEESEYRIADGSGLSLYNYTTALIEVSFLRYAYSKRKIFKILYDSLPSAGVDGTLKRRMTDNEYTTGNVHAKTGSVSCISSLAGYCRADNGHDIAFCIINQGVLKSKNARAFQDSVCTILCEPTIK